MTIKKRSSLNYGCQDVHLNIFITLHKKLLKSCARVTARALKKPKILGLGCSLVHVVMGKSKANFSLES